MKWFKHDSDANTDAKLKRLRMKYGLEGYGLYWYCIELITNDISDNNLTFELEHDAEVIAFDVGMNYEKVQDMMTYMVNLGLFENNNGRLTCLKILKRLDASMTSSNAMRTMIQKARNELNQKVNDKSHDEVMIESGKVMQDYTRLDKTRLENNKPIDHLMTDFDLFYDMYPKKVGRKKCEDYFNKHKPDIDLILNALLWQKETEQWQNSKFIPNPYTYLNQQRWLDEPVEERSPF
jgi:hypothetical protein